MIEMRTITISYAITSLVCASLMTFLWLQNRKRFAGIGFWLGQFIVVLFAVVLLGLRRAIPDFLSIIVGNTLVIFGFILILMGLRRFTGRPGTQVYNFIYLILFTLIHVYFTYGEPSLLARNTNTSVAMVFFSVQIVWFVFGQTGSKQPVKMDSLGFIFVLYIIISTIRFLLDLIFGPGYDFLSSSSVGLSMLAYQSLQIALTLSFFLQINQTLLVELEQDISESLQAEKALRESELRFRAVTQSAEDGIVTVNSDNFITGWNRGAENIFGYTEAEALGQPLTILMPPRLHKQYFRQIDRVRQGAKRNLLGKTVEMRGQRKNGTIFSLEMSTAEWRVGESQFYTAIIRDITERKTVEESLLRRNQELASLYQISLEMNALSDLSALLNTIVQRACALLDVPFGALHLTRTEAEILETVVVHQLPLDWVGKKIRLDEGLAGQVVRTKEPAMVEDYQSWEGRLSTYPASPARGTLGVPLKVHDHVIGVLILLSDQVRPFDEEEIRLASLFAGQAAIAVENAQLYDRVHQLAITDTLTGSFNRTFFDAELSRLETSRDFPMSIVVADLDNLKLTNDTLGHSAGDDLLKYTAAIIQSAFRTSDIIARIGGDEFAILLPKTDAATVEQILGRMRTKIAEHNTDRPLLPVQLSLGAATTGRGKLIEAFILADRNMYADKAVRKAKSS